MRARPFRPAFDRLDPRIAPSDANVLPVGPGPDSGGYVSTANDPGLTADSGGTEYCSGGQSGYDPTNPPPATN